MTKQPTPLQILPLRLDWVSNTKHNTHHGLIRPFESGHAAYNSYGSVIFHVLMTFDTNPRFRQQEHLRNDWCGTWRNSVTLQQIGYVSTEPLLYSRQIQIRDHASNIIPADLVSPAKCMPSLFGWLSLRRFVSEARWTRLDYNSAF